MEIRFSPIEPKFFQFETLMNQASAARFIANNQRYVGAGAILQADRTAKADQARFNEFASAAIESNPQFIADYCNVYLPMITAIREQVAA